MKISGKSLQEYVGGHVRAQSITDNPTEERWLFWGVIGEIDLVVYDANSGVASLVINWAGFARWNEETKQWERARTSSYSMVMSFFDQASGSNDSIRLTSDKLLLLLHITKQNDPSNILFPDLPRKVIGAEEK